ncbi:MAG: radical SAM protein [Candidatus Woesearchaeota archaeon]
MSFKQIETLTKIFRNKGLPSYIIFYVTSICNSKCKMCFNWKYNNNVTKEELTLEEIDNFSKKLKHLQYVTLGGGEPTLRKDLPEICEIFYKNNNAQVFSIPTNGLLPKQTYDHTLNILNKCPGVNIRISLSIDGIGEDHDNIRGVPGNFEKIKETYKLLDEIRKKYKNFEILANTTFSAYNQDKIKKIVKQLNSDFVFDMQSVTLVRGNSRELIAKKIDFSKYQELIKFLEEEYLEKTISNRKFNQRMLNLLPFFTRREIIKTSLADKRTYTCYAGKNFVVIDSFGNVYACEMLPNKLGNLRKEGYDLKSILEKEETKKLLESIKDKKCNCTWECAIQNSLVFNHRNYHKYIRSKLN